MCRLIVRDAQNDRGVTVLRDPGKVKIVRFALAVAIDEDWSALRFRRVEDIKTGKR